MIISILIPLLKIKLAMKITSDWINLDSTKLYNEVL